MRPRYLTTARGAKFESREMAQAVLDAIPCEAVEHWATEYIAEQEELSERDKLSPTHLRELRRCVRKDGYWSPKR